MQENLDTFALECLCLVFESEVVRSTILASLVDDGNSLQADEEIFVLPADAGPVTSAEVVKVRNLLEDEVNESQDDCDTQRVGPDSNDGDWIGKVSRSQTFWGHSKTHQYLSNAHDAFRCS